ncbi:MAG: hypothetical protein K2X27_18290 [Candidatus Obscuribacterales bacterium]|nr:hypothetical protein [Candidatus Obscuribacterales bacterium]
MPGKFLIGVDHANGPDRIAHVLREGLNVIAISQVGFKSARLPDGSLVFTAPDCKPVSYHPERGVKVLG